MAGGRLLLYGGAMERDLAALLADAEWLPHRVVGGSVRFVRLPVAERACLPFLDERFVGENLPSAEVPLARLAGREPAAEGGCHFIFHSAFCGSTLLARALGSAGGATVLQEPRALADLAAALPAAGRSGEARQAIDTVLAFLQRPGRPGETAIIKPSNFANPLIGDLLDLRPESKALLIYSRLPDFLLTIARRGKANRPWARRMATLFRRHPQFDPAEAVDLLLLTDLQAAAWVWLQHQAQFSRLLAEQPEGRIATLERGAFLADPARALTGAAALFGLDLDEAGAAALAAGPVFRHHSMRPDRPFDPATLKREEAAARFAYGAEIETAAEWAAELAGRAGVPLTLGSPVHPRD
ncbi:MAG TPA: hypothetical protein VFR28_01775 [Allosphingosinicella sp.]|nr:hypothetical protein [Allosphingosinicella sp.]